MLSDEKIRDCLEFTRDHNGNIMLNYFAREIERSARAQALEDAAKLCDAQRRVSWNDDRKEQARLDAQEIRELINKEQAQ